MQHAAGLKNPRRTRLSRLRIVRYNPSCGDGSGFSAIPKVSLFFIAIFAMALSRSILGPPKGQIRVLNLYHLGLCLTMQELES